jgi:membrane protein involved in colicin uptake
MTVNFAGIKEREVKREAKQRAQRQAEEAKWQAEEAKRQAERAEDKEVRFSRFFVQQSFRARH